MPTIVKYKYVGPLLAALRDNAGASAAQIAAGLNTPTEGVGVVAEVSTADFVAVMSADALAKMKDYATTAATAEKDATRAAAIGLLTHLDAGTVSMVAGTEARKCADALSAAGFLSVDEVGKLTSLATRPGAGPSAAQTMGLGECLPQFIAQVAEYEKLTGLKSKHSWRRCCLCSGCGPGTRHWRVPRRRGRCRSMRHSVPTWYCPTRRWPTRKPPTSRSMRPSRCCRGAWLNRR